MPKLMQDPQAGHSVVDYSSDRPVAPNYAALMRDARRVAKERIAEYGAKSQKGRLRSQHQQLAEVYSHSHRSGGGVSQGDSGNEQAFYAMRGESLRDAAHEASLGRLRGGIQLALAKGKGKKTRTKDDPPPPPNFLFYPVRKGSSSSRSVGAVGSVPAEPVIKLLRLLHAVTSKLDALAAKDKIMQQEIEQQGAALAQLKSHRQQQQQQQPVVHAALAMSSVSFPSPAAAASELTAHPGDVLQIGSAQVVLPPGINPGVYNVRQVDGSIELDAVQQ